MLRAAVTDFRTANNLPGTDQAILTEAECDTLKRNNDAVYTFIGFKQVINPVNQLKMTFLVACSRRRPRRRPKAGRSTRTRL